MPCWERLSTSWIFDVFSAVIWSSSFRRSLIGWVCRSTYFFLANGCVTRFTRFGSSPSQKSCEEGSCNRSRSLLCIDAAELDEFEFVCAQVAGVSMLERNIATTIWLFILTFPGWMTTQPSPMETFIALDCPRQRMKPQARMLPSTLVVSGSPDRRDAHVQGTRLSKGQIVIDLGDSDNQERDYMHGC